MFEEEIANLEKVVGSLGKEWEQAVKDDNWRYVDLIHRTRVHLWDAIYKLQNIDNPDKVW